jgi:hypothetical protein
MSPSCPPACSHGSSCLALPLFLLLMSSCLFTPHVLMSSSCPSHALMSSSCLARPLLVLLMPSCPLLVLESSFCPSHVLMSACPFLVLPALLLSSYSSLAPSVLFLSFSCHLLVLLISSPLSSFCPLPSLSFYCLSSIFFMSSLWCFSFPSSLSREDHLMG